MTVIEPHRPSVQEIEDTAGALGPNGLEVNTRVPHHLTDSEHIPTARYTSREFHELEKKNLWPHVWQMACREEEVPNPGDYVEYEIVGQSILVIRQKDGSLKAVHNACRHRGTQLARGSGRFPGNQIVCPFHGWRFGIDGVCTNIYGRSGFSEDVLDEEINLQEVQVDTWGGHVFINMDLDAKPLLEELFPVANLLDLVNVEHMRVKWWKEAIINCNWKLAQEAFFESYHVRQTHPQIFMVAQDEDDESNQQPQEYKTYVNGHGLFQTTAGGRTEISATAMNYLELSRRLWKGQDAMTLERDVTVMEMVAGQTDPDDPSYPAKAIAALFDYWETAGIPTPERKPEVMKLWGGDVFVFPNYLMLPLYTNALCYRVRPHNDDPDWCRFEVWSLTTYLPGNEPGRPELLGTFDKDDADHWGMIPRQDFSNLERMQRGVKSQSMPQTRLSETYEMLVSNMHQELDRRLAIDHTADAE